MTVSLFSGQGSQYPGMGLNLLAAHPALAVIYDTASSILGFDLKEIIQNSEAETLSRTIYAQPAIMATSLCCLGAAKGETDNHADNSYNAGLFIVNSLYTAEGVMDKHSLWQRYVPLVRHEALRLQVRLPASVELDDLLQAGGIGLLNAVERYDALQGTAFTTYAVQRIRGAMLDELRSRDWVPRSVRRNAREVAQAIGQLEQELGRNATETEVAERLGIDIADYRQMLLDTNNSQLFSYDEWREEHGDSIELVTDDHQRENPLQQLLDSNLRQRVMEAIETLPEREKLVLTLYYQEELNLKEIGAVLEVGESRVSQLHSQAIKRLRTKLGKL